MKSATLTMNNEVPGIFAIFMHLWRRFRDYNPTFIGTLVQEEGRVLSHIMMRLP